MPKQRITRDMVIDAAFALARSGGMEQVTAKRIAGQLGCSVQPIYSYCQNMEGLRQALAARVRSFMQEYLAAHVEKSDLFRSTGRAYLRLAREEPHLFQIFILHRRTGITSLDELYRAEANPQAAAWIAGALHISEAQAQALHLNMLIFTIGIGTIFSVTTPGIPPEEIYEQQERAFQAFLRQEKEAV